MTNRLPADLLQVVLENATKAAKLGEFSTHWDFVDGVHVRYRTISKRDDHDPRTWIAQKPFLATSLVCTAWRDAARALLAAHVTRTVVAFRKKGEELVQDVQRLYQEEKEFNPALEQRIIDRFQVYDQWNYALLPLTYVNPRGCRGIVEHPIVKALVKEWPWHAGAYVYIAYGRLGYAYCKSVSTGEMGYVGISKLYNPKKVRRKKNVDEALNTYDHHAKERMITMTIVMQNAHMRMHRLPHRSWSERAKKRAREAAKRIDGYDGYSEYRQWVDQCDWMSSLAWGMMEWL